MVARRLIVIMMAVLMAVSVLPAYIADGSDADDLPKMELVKNDNGSYTLESDYLDSIFGTESMKESEINDPIGAGPVSVSPLEIVHWGGGSDSKYTVWDVGKTDGPIYDEKFGINTDSNHAVSFPAALTRGYEGDDSRLTSDGEEWGENGFQKRDWYCNMYYDNNTGSLNIAVTNGKVSATLDIDGSNNSAPFPTYEIDHISSQQSVNILNYTVGDYDGDGNEEIAVHHIFTIRVYGFDATSLTLKELYHFDAPSYTGDGYTNTLFTPVSMASGDLDGDGSDEIAITRGYYKGGQSLSNGFTDLGVLDTNIARDKTPGTPAGKWTRVTMIDPNNSASMLDSVMTGVTIADINADRINEIVLGGYLWDNSNTSYDYTKVWERAAGELYLTYLHMTDYYAGNIVWNGLTILGDDNDTASTRFIDNSDFKNYTLGDHNRKDTSIWIGDTNDNPIGLCKNPNWCNWTIPLESGSFGDVSDSGYASCQLYFNTWFYEFTGSMFNVYKKTPQLSITMDGNNVVCNSVTFGQFFDQTSNEFNGKEDAVVFYGADLMDNFDDGMTEWVYVVYTDSDEGAAKSQYSGISYLDGYRDMREWGENGLYNVGRSFVGNFDADTYFVDLLCHVFTYTDPSLVAVISAVPYEQDLADVLVWGATNIGTTGYTDYTSTEKGDGSTIQFHLGPSASQGGKITKLALDLQIYTQWEFEWMSSTTTTISTEYVSSHESLALYIIPMDLYLYQLTGPDVSEDTGLYQIVPHYREAITTVMGYDEYCTFIDNYNTMAGNMYGDDFSELEKVTMFDNTEGDIASYDDPVPADAIINKQVSYDASGAPDMVNCAIDMSSNSEYTWMGGAGFDLSMVFPIGGFNTGFNGSKVSTEVDTTGMTFTSSLYQGMRDNYNGDMADCDTVLSEYSMTGNLWAQYREFTYVDGETQQYVYLGYTVSDYKTAPKMGKLVAHPDDLDKDSDDEYKPTNDATFLRATIPGKMTSGDRYADSYNLQIKWQGVWHDMKDVDLEMYVAVQDGDEWKDSDGVFFSDMGEEIWIRVSGLSNYEDNVFTFRLNAVKTVAANTYINPSMGVDAYTDTYIGTVVIVDDAESMEFGTSGRGTVLDGSGRHCVILEKEFSGYGKLTAIIKTDFEPGTIVDLWAKDGQDYRMVAHAMQVSCGGVLIYEEDNGDEGTALTPLYGVLAFLAIGIVFVFVFRRY